MRGIIRLSSLIAILLIADGSYAQVAAGNPGKAAILAGIDDIHTRMLQVNQAIWSYAEPGLEETQSSQELQDWLSESGFSVRAGVAGMPTAFVASYGEGEPVIAYLAEYDALLGVSQKALPYREVRDDPSIIAGHGCGHSVFGTGTTAAAIALAWPRSCVPPRMRSRPGSPSGPRPRRSSRTVAPGDALPNAWYPQ